MTLAKDIRLGPYAIQALLGQGGMGEVYRALDTRLDRLVAIKVLRPDVADSPVRRQRFEREARAVSSLSHPHICPLYDISERDGVPFLVMEYLEGETLSERLARGVLPIDQVLRYAIEMTDALDHAHRHGVIHRDLKPSNVMLTPSGVKLLDFGVAKLYATDTIGSASVAATQTSGRSPRKGCSSARRSTWRLSNWKRGTRTRERTSSRLARSCTKWPRAVPRSKGGAGRASLLRFSSTIPRRFR
jgi:serine/threonine protein kinase